MTPECKKELNGGHVIYNLQINIASGATGEQADITFLRLVTILDHQMTGKIDSHCRERFHLVKAKVRQGGVNGVACMLCLSGIGIRHNA